MSDRPFYRFVVRLEDDGVVRLENLDVTCASDKDAIRAAKIFAESCASLSLWRGDIALWNSTLSRRH
ncbi:MAG: hypothetical protein AB7G40_10805 [Hyphomonadaceae bacterium]